MIIDFISDTHTKHHFLQLPIKNRHMIVHCGDITNRGNLRDIEDFARWMKSLEYEHAIVIAGNHDFCFFSENKKEAIEILNVYGIHYLQDNSITIDGKVFYGMPWTPTFYDWAFMKDPGDDMKKVTDKIPLNTDVLISHGPPRGIFDEVVERNITMHVGSEELRDRILEVKPTVVAFGHIHGYKIRDKIIGKTRYVNASFLNEAYFPKDEHYARVII